jgi:surface protein
MSIENGVITVTNKNIRKMVKMYFTGNLPDAMKTIPIGKWDVSKVTDMNSLFNMFEGDNEEDTNGLGYDINETLAEWDVSNVKDMSYMFHGCRDFNININMWNVGNVESMYSMFCYCYKFNKPLNNWNVSKVKTMNHMFHCCFLFNKPLNRWNVSEVEDMEGMFEQCRMFNQPLSSWRPKYSESGRHMFHVDLKRGPRPASWWGLREQERQFIQGEEDHRNRSKPAQMTQRTWLDRKAIDNKMDVLTEMKIQSNMRNGIKPYLMEARYDPFERPGVSFHGEGYREAQRHYNEMKKMESPERKDTMKAAYRMHNRSKKKHDVGKGGSKRKKK